MRSYYIDVRGQIKGPYTLQQLRAMWTRGTITPRNLYCEEGGDKWRKLELMQSVLETSEKKPDSEQGMNPGQWFLTQIKKIAASL